jgi:phage replication-related protein YjqB (UPF0714/DUF867 family)
METLTEIHTSPDSELDPDRKCKDRCSISASLAERLDLEIGNHIRVDRGPYATYYRIRRVHTDTSRPLLVHEDHLNRFGVAPSTEVRVSTTIPQETREEASRNGGLAEILKDDGEQDRLLVAAPHGGDVERGTHEMAETCFGLFEDDGIPVSLWMLLGYRSPAQELSSYRTWHIGSPMRGRQGYPGLMKIVDREFDVVVGFHRSAYNHIEVGGKIDRDTREQVGRTLREKTGKRVKTELSELNLPGTHSKVSVNYLSKEGGLHLECTPGTCDHHQHETVEVIFDVLKDRM